MLILFFYIKGIIHYKYLFFKQEGGVNQLLERLQQHIHHQKKKKRRRRRRRRRRRSNLYPDKWLLHHYNGPSHNAPPVKRLLAKM
jgi:hypothetical protein